MNVMQNMDAVKEKVKQEGKKHEQKKPSKTPDPRKRSFGKPVGESSVTKERKRVYSKACHQARKKAVMRGKSDEEAMSIGRKAGKKALNDAGLD